MGRDRGWRRATGASVTAEGGCTNNKMAAGGAPSAPSRPLPHPLGSARGCAATPAWPADERVVLRKERTRAYLVNSFRMSGRLKYWPGRAAKPTTTPFYLPIPILPPPPALPRRNPCGGMRLLKTISNPRISSGLPRVSRSGHTRRQRRPCRVEFSSSSLNDFR